MQKNHLIRNPVVEVWPFWAIFFLDMFFYIYTSNTHTCYLITHANIWNKGITVLEIFIWGGILSDIWSEIKFHGNVRAEPYNMISDHKPPQRNHFDMVIPILMHFCSLV